MAQFNNALADQFASLIIASPEDLQAAVISAQRTMCTILNMDRSSIWQGSAEAPEVLRMTHLCTLDEIPPFPEDITTNRDFPWFTAQLLAGRTVAVPDVNALPPEAAVDRDSLAHYLDKSTLAIPFPRRPGERAGVITFSATTRRESWSEAVLAQCRLVVEVIHAVLLRATAEEAVRTERTKLRMVLDSTSTDLIWYVDSSSYALASWNRAYAQYCKLLTGTTIKIGDTPEVIFRGDTTRVRRWTELYERAIREGTFTIETPLDMDGIIVLLEFNRVINDDRCVGVAAFGRDITFQKKQRAELEELQHQLTHAQKLEAIGRLAATVAHDFNNLLTVIMATTDAICAELVDRGDQDGRSLAASLKPIEDAAVKGAALTRRLLTLARPQPHQPRPIDVVRVLSEAEPLFRRLLPKNIELSVRVPPRSIYVLAEPSQLDQVVLNLAVNARDAMRSGGRLDVGVEERDLEVSGVAAFEGLAPGPYIELTVSDTGEGIPPDVLERIFEPFFTTKPPGKGSGLGLATVLAIVRQARGDLTVTSKVGEGTKFRLLLPRTTAPLEEPAAGALSVPAKRGETVLVTDDDEDVRLVIQRMLRANGYRVLTAATGDEALTLLQAENGRVDLLITDVVMSGMSGLELGRSVRARYPKMPILFITGFSSAAPDELASVSPLPVLLKPCTTEALARAAREAIAGARI